MDSTTDTVALLCPGPSLIERWRDAYFEDYYAVIAVNSAAHLYRCHWLAAVDGHVIQPIIEGKFEWPKVGALTNPGQGKKFRDIGCSVIRPDPNQGKGTEHALHFFYPEKHCGYTFPNALWFALQFPGQIEIFGFDAALNQPCVGNMPGGRKADRWRKELVWVKAFWQADRISVNSELDPSILDWLNDGNPILTEPPIYGDKHSNPSRTATAPKATLQSDLAIKQSLLDAGPKREESKVPHALGPKALLRDNVVAKRSLESPPDRDQHVHRNPPARPCTFQQRPNLRAN
jgi:hypothetical protein